MERHRCYLEVKIRLKIDSYERDIVRMLMLGLVSMFQIVEGLFERNHDAQILNARVAKYAPDDRGTFWVFSADPFYEMR